MPEKPILVETMLLGSSIENLKKFGSSDREIEYYERLSSRFEVFLLSYCELSVSNKAIREISRKFQNKWLNSILAPLIVRKMVSTRIGVIRAKQFWGSWAAWLLARSAHKKFILRCGYVWSQGLFVGRPSLGKVSKYILINLEKFFVSKADAYIFASEEIYRYYAPYVKKKPCVVIPNGFNTKIFYPSTKANVTYDFIYSGRLIELKGIKKMLDLVPYNMRLAVVGEGPLLSNLSKYENVEYLGVIPNSELAKYLRRSKCYISMSSTEGNPKCLIEAILCGLYPVVSDITAHRQLIEELGYGLVCKPGMTLENINERPQVDQIRLKKFTEKYSMTSVIEKEIEFSYELIQ